MQRRYSASVAALQNTQMRYWLSYGRSWKALMVTEKANHVLNSTRYTESRPSIAEKKESSSYLKTLVMPEYMSSAPIWTWAEWNWLHWVMIMHLPHSLQMPLWHKCLLHSGKRIAYEELTEKVRACIINCNACHMHILRPLLHLLSSRRQPELVGKQ